MIGFIVAGLFIGWAVGFLWIAEKVIDRGNPVTIAALAAWVIVPLGLLFNAMLEVEANGPCHRYETHMQYNAATKTVMPYRVCVERGEWVEE